MRLIDADTVGIDLPEPWQVVMVWKEVERAPTVEAIPVDWLREHRKQMRLKRSARLIENMIRLYQEEQER